MNGIIPVGQYTADLKNKIILDICSPILYNKGNFYFEEIIMLYGLLYILIGFIWVCWSSPKFMNKEYSTNRLLLIISTNLILWWICIPVWLIAKVFFKRDTLFN
jgi:hypothetical protein